MRISSNIKTIQEAIDSAAIRSGRTPSDISIICVTKTRTVDEICQVLDSGISNIGENKVQEAEEKHIKVREHAKSLNIPLKLHMIGHLQTNKAKKACDIFDMIQSIDTIKLASKLNEVAKGRGRSIDVLIEVNVSGESVKYGIQPDNLFDVLTAMSDLDRIRIRGLMTMAPLSDNPENSRPYFRKLRELSNRIKELDGKMFNERVRMDYLSMGMSQDYVVAVEEGASMVRIGSAIFQEAV